ncbi:phospholipid carrier-dependent glycosyltransferase [Hymenobacter gummosus]|uniref:Phospholipid carrier-dependent glycosyltransferase n=1 Tax=Hymenobacter gummosus TaxID=1776032 RepID=A0A3S0JDJ4_9BACT|nr:glycosyltransferase family 39 protein [Hymenobacter gummosus]RTQ45826.1 phospholipid carrier-dependent glycosyltransferase [Hymenobacter gummosus]
MSRPLSLAALLLTLVTAGFLLFWKLGGLPVQQWDECRTGLNALEMLARGEYLVPYYRGQPDLWNAKPPLHVWLLMLSFASLGPSELALRLPAALAALATVGLVYAAGRRWLGHAAAGLLAALALVTAGGFTTLHVARAGDFDATLTLWTTAGTLAWLGYLRSGRTGLAWLTGGSYALAFMTKGIAALLPGPGLVLAVWATGRSARLRRPAPWLAAGLVLAVALGWYGLREALSPGYLEAVREFELRMATDNVENNGQPLLWYVGHLLEANFSAWLAPALLAVVLAWRRPDGSPAQLLVRGAATVAGTQLLILSLTRTKLAWYDAPLYPLLALLAAAGVVWAGRALAAHYRWQPRPAWLLLPLLVAAGPYADRLAHLRELHQRRFQNATLLYGRHLTAQATQRPELQEYLVATDSLHNDSPEFYRVAAQRRYGHRSGWVHSTFAGQPEPGTVVVTCGAAARRPWLARYQVETLLQTDSCVTMRLLQRR